MGGCLVFSLFASLGIFKRFSQFIRCPYFTSLLSQLFQWEYWTLGMHSVMLLCYLMAQLFTVDHIEYKTFRRDRCCLKVETIDKGQERQYFIYIPMVLFPLLTSISLWTYISFFPVKIYNTELLLQMNQSCYTAFDIVETIGCRHKSKTLLNEIILVPFAINQQSCNSIMNI